VIYRVRTNMQTGTVARSFAWASSSLFATRSAGISPDGRSSAAVRQNRSSSAHGIVDLSALVPGEAGVGVGRFVHEHQLHGRHVIEVGSCEEAEHADCV
jgi:copper oxidase (laccase) domain-containing protein